MIYPVILSGGSGSRLWPVSREQYPKQFLSLHRPGVSLLQETAQRLSNLEETGTPLIVCNEQHRFMVAEQMHQSGVSAQILLEPCARNTAPALTLAALLAVQIDPDAELLSMPADHVIKDEQRFATAIKQGLGLAQQGKLVTFGITPSSAHTGYGYIKRGQADGEGFAVSTFVEKPDPEQARTYVENGNYLWNSGIFLFGANAYINALRQYAPDILEACEHAFASRQQDLDFLRINSEMFARCRSESIDYAVMEHTKEAVVVPMDPGWSDIGAWDALYDLTAEGEDGNAVQGDVITDNVRNSLIRSESRLVAAVGVDHLVIVETADAVLVADRNDAQATKHIVHRLKEQGRKEAELHQTVFRPWGSYTTLALTNSFQVKEIIVNPGAKLSLQMHHHRAEHWVVVKGTAKVTQGDMHQDSNNLKSFLLSEDESTYIPLGTPHRLENPGVIPLHLIEVQTGSYLGEDDIVRFDDEYGRSRDGSL